MPDSKQKPRKRWRSRLLKRVLLSTVAFLISALIAEAGLRVVGVAYLLPYQPDEHCGTRLRPGLEGRFHREGGAYVRINRHGNRDREHSITKPPGVYRIAVLGDSYAEALQVNREETFWARMEESLNRRGGIDGKTVEVLNFGVSGYGTAQELQMLRHYVWPFEPDLVLLAFLTGNDVVDNDRVLCPNQAKPFFDLVDGQLQLDVSFRQHHQYLKALSTSTRWKVAMINSSRLLQLINEVKTRWEQREGQDEGKAELGELGLDWRVYQPPADDDWRRAWQLSEALIKQAHTETTARGCRFLLVCLSNGVQVDPDAERRQAFADAHGLEDLLYPDRRIERFCREQGIPHLLLAPELGRLAMENGTYFHGFENTDWGTGHWNSDGHREAGRLIADTIRLPQTDD